MSNKNNQKGFVGTAALVILGILLVLGALSYFYLKSQGKEPKMFQKTMYQKQESSTPEPISGSDDLDTLDEEFKDTQVGSPDSDFQEIDADASAL